MSYRITGLDADLFRPLFGLSDEALEAHRARRVIATETPGFPERIGVRDAAVGESLILVNHTHQDADGPYHASHAVYVSEAGGSRYDRVGEVPEVLRLRPISLRAFTDAGDLVDADLAEGDGVEPTILRLLADDRVAYLHAHFARPGCYAARIERA